MRLRKKESNATLVQEIETLELRLRAMQNGDRPIAAILSWRDVAMALELARESSSAMNRVLRYRVKAIEKLASNLRLWVASMSNVPTHLNPTRPTWRNVTLLADPTSRQLGKAWILRQMHHHTERVFQRYGFPADHVPFDVCEIDMCPTNGISYVFGIQRDLNMSTEMDLLDKYTHNMCYMLRVNFGHAISPHTVHEADGDILLHQLVSNFGEFSNVLTTSFRTADRFVVVAQSIQDDECVPGETQNFFRHRSYWAEIYQLQSDQWKYRFIYFLSQRRHRVGQYTPLEDEARVWGYDVSDVLPEVRERKFRHWVQTTWHGLRVQHDLNSKRSLMMC
ncbi:Aste57867_8644 [Aphanomyces stellatus]|uniref:Aste57867_8644 protein n=1 Tax=Aphanomyces stellatus TaxID=120398 RepID=A0A485KKU1_9STRA|nr:hypothetical protein As57867_008610 [Aphanomyces stellatus]VFT85530.1 Aste57867_8644 [Aphanomyces stellatus]